MIIVTVETSVFFSYLQLGVILHFILSIAHGGLPPGWKTTGTYAIKSFKSGRYLKLERKPLQAPRLSFTGNFSDRGTGKMIFIFLNYSG